MFWRFGFHTQPAIDVLLEKDNVTLQEVLDEEDVLQECKSPNRKLIDLYVPATHPSSRPRARAGPRALRCSRTWRSGMPSARAWVPKRAGTVADPTWGGWDARRI